jgi:hypothetical protein
MYCCPVRAGMHPHLSAPGALALRVAHLCCRPGPRPGCGLALPALRYVERRDHGLPTSSSSQPHSRATEESHLLKMMVKSKYLNGIPGASIDEHQSHRRSRLFPIQIAVMVDRGISQTAWGSVLAQLAKRCPCRFDLFCLRLKQSKGDLDVCMRCRCQSLTDILWYGQMSIR